MLYAVFERCDCRYRFCFVKFANEADAAAAFEKGKNLKVGGNPIDVMYARFKADKN